MSGGILLKTSAHKALRHGSYRNQNSSLKPQKKQRLSSPPSHQKRPSIRNDDWSFHAAFTGIITWDIGIAMLSMHSARELIARKDIDALENLLTALFKAS